MKHIVQKGLNSQNTPKLPEVKKPQVSTYVEVKSFELPDSLIIKNISKLLIDIVNGSRSFEKNSFLKRDKFTNSALILEQTEAGKTDNGWKLNPPLSFLIPDSIFITPDVLILRSKLQETGLGFKRKDTFDVETDKDITRTYSFIEKELKTNSIEPSENPVPTKIEEILEDPKNHDKVMTSLYSFLRNRIYEELDVR